MRYHLSPMAVIVKVCGEAMLIPTLELRKTAPKSCVLNETAEFYIGCMNEHLTVEEMLKRAAQEYAVSEDEIREGVLDWLSDFEKKGYIIKEE